MFLPPFVSQGSLSWETGRGDLTLGAEHALVCPAPGVVWPGGHRNLGSKGEVWPKMTSKSSAILSQAGTGVPPKNSLAEEKGLAPQEASTGSP